MAETQDDYGIAPIAPTKRMAAPRLGYKPHNPKKYNPPIALIGCGGISLQHLKAYKAAGKHVLSQKPFVLDLDYGEKLVELADRRGVRLAVNQNARWAPHFSYMREAIKRGLIGEVLAAHLAVHWDHNWIVGTEFENV